MALTIPKPLFTTLVISSLCIPFFTWITVDNKTFPWNILLPAFSIILDAILNILLIFLFPPNSVPQAPSLWAKTLVDVIINFGSAAIQTLSPRSLVYLLMSNFALIYLITLLLVVKSTNFALLDLFIAITPSFFQYFGEEKMFWLLIPSSILLGFLICVRNNNETITVSMCIAKTSVNLLGIKVKNLFDSLRDSLVFIWKWVVKHEIGEEAAAAAAADAAALAYDAAAADYVTIHVDAGHDEVDDGGDRASDESAVTVGIGAGAIAVANGGADERDGDDGAIQICGAPAGDAYELVGDFEEVSGVDDEADDDDGAIQIGVAAVGEFGNYEADYDDGAIQTAEAPTGDAYEQVGEAEDAGGVDDGFGNYEAEDDDSIHTGGASASVGVTTVHSADEQNGDGAKDAGGVDHDGVVDDEADHRGDVIDKAGDINGAVNDDETDDGVDGQPDAAGDVNEATSNPKPDIGNDEVYDGDDVVDNGGAVDEGVNDDEANT